MLQRIDPRGCAAAAAPSLTANAVLDAPSARAVPVPCAPTPCARSAMGARLTRRPRAKRRFGGASATASSHRPARR
jgi:hypothetical protein